MAVDGYNRAIQLIEEARASIGKRQYSHIDLDNAYHGRARALDRLERHIEALSDWEAAIAHAAKSRSVPAYDLLAGKGALPSSNWETRRRQKRLIDQIATATLKRGDAYFVAAASAALLGEPKTGNLRDQGIELLRKAHRRRLVPRRLLAEPAQVRSRT